MTRLESWARKANVSAWAVGSVVAVTYLAMSDLTLTERLARELWWILGLVIAPHYVLLTHELLKSSAPMKAITLHQPWATLIAIGRKRHETRHWPVPDSLIGERVAIHAGKYIERDAVAEFGLDLHSVLHNAGKILATAVIESAFQIGRQGRAPVSGREIVAPINLRGMPQAEWVCTDDYGDWTVGRWIWCLADVQPFSQPIPARGRQAFWNVPPEAMDEMPGYGA